MTDSDAVDLTEMEGLALGLVKQMQPTSAYALAATFSSSPSTYWSGSAGAVYPLVRRLEKAGLLLAEKSHTGKRKSTLYSLSTSGEAAFKAWLLDVERAVNPGFDPLRSRATMLQLVTPRARASFLAKVERKLAEQQEEGLPEDRASERFRGIHKSWLSHRLRWLKDLKKLVTER